MFESLFTTAVTETTGNSLEISTSIICILTALVLGAVISGVYIITSKKKDYSSGFTVSLVLLPAIVSIIIMLVGSNVARAFSIAGAFSLVRFRSAPGDAKDISAVFFTMAVGLAAGMGYVIFAAVITLIIGIAMLALDKVGFGKKTTVEKQLRITIPEDMNYSGAFDDLFEAYTKGAELEKVKTANMGTLYELTYRIKMKKDINEKEFMDSIRCRNGNLNIVLGVVPANTGTTIL